MKRRTFIAGNMDLNVNPDGVSVFERRSRTDRRGKPTPFLSRYWLIGNRRGGRRLGERINLYVDRYTTCEWLIVIGVFVLSIADVTLTLTHLSQGGVEANPIMALAYSHGSAMFVSVKLCVTAFCMFFLLIHMRFRRSQFFLAFAFIIYAGVFLYHQTLAMIVE